MPCLKLILQLFGLTTNAQSKLVLHDAIFLATCLAMALQRQVVGRLQCVTCPVCNLSYNFFGLTTNAQSKLVLYDAIFLATCLAMVLRRQVVGRLQRVTCPVRNLSYNFLALQRMHRVSWCYTMQFLLQRVSQWCCGDKLWVDFNV